MKTIVLLRHAKTENRVDVHDIERNLLPEGKLKAVAMAKALHNIVQKLDIIVSSPSKRTKQTSEIFRKISFRQTPIVLEDSFYYMATDDHVQNIIYGQNNTHDTMMLVGHNPVFTFLAQKFSGNNDIYLYPASLCVFYFDTNSWQEISPICCIKHIHLNAKDIEQ